jgi:periplasmic divalent cation tolerance protein
MTDKIIVLSSCSSAAEADGIARQLLEKRLAACVNVLAGARSLYRWQGAIEEAAECLLIIKSRQDLWEPLRAEIQSLHSYEVPEILLLAIEDGSPKYLDWLNEELAKEA